MVCNSYLIHFHYLFLGYVFLHSQIVLTMNQTHTIWSIDIDIKTLSISSKAKSAHLPTIIQLSFSLGDLIIP